MIQQIILVVVLSFCCLNLTGTSVQAEDVFLDRIAPLLERRCVSCHNDRQQEGTSHYKRQRARWPMAISSRVTAG